jgi:hypothetical protein
MGFEYIFLVITNFNNMNIELAIQIDVQSCVEGLFFKNQPLDLLPSISHKTMQSVNVKYAQEFAKICNEIILVKHISKIVVPKHPLNCDDFT